MYGAYGSANQVICPCTPSGTETIDVCSTVLARPGWKRTGPEFRRLRGGVLPGCICRRSPEQHRLIMPVGCCSDDKVQRIAWSERHRIAMSGLVVTSGVPLSSSS
jgi:hypothetical protein